MNTTLKVYLNDKIKTNFVYVSLDIIKSLNLVNNNNNNNIHIVKIKKINSEKGKNIYLGFVGGTTEKHNCIEISSKFGEALNLTQGEYIKFSMENEGFDLFNTDTLSNFNITPLTNYDYKLIEINSEFFEENLLNQIIVVYDELIFPFIFYDNKIAYLKVNLENKNKAFIISQDSELNVAYVPETDLNNNEENKENNNKKNNEFIIYDNFQQKFFLKNFDSNNNNKNKNDIKDYNNDSNNNSINKEKEKENKYLLKKFPKKNNFYFNNTIKFTTKFLRENKILKNFNININNDYDNDLNFNLEIENNNNNKLNLLINLSINFNSINDIIVKIPDFFSISQIFNQLKKLKNSGENFEILDFLNNEILLKIPNLSNLWFNISIDDTIEENEIQLKEFCKLFSLLNEEGEYLQLKILKNLDINSLRKKLEDKNFLKFLKENLKLEINNDDNAYNSFNSYNGFDNNNNDNSEINFDFGCSFEYIKAKFIEEIFFYFDNYDDILIFNLDLLYKFTYFDSNNYNNNNIFYRFRFDGNSIINKYYELLNKMKINFTNLFNEYKIEKEAERKKQLNNNNLNNYNINNNKDKENFIDLKDLIFSKEINEENKTNYSNMIILTKKIAMDLFDINENILNELKDNKQAKFNYLKRINTKFINNSEEIKTEINTIISIKTQRNIINKNYFENSYKENNNYDNINDNHNIDKDKVKDIDNLNIYFTNNLNKNLKKLENSLIKNDINSIIIKPILDFYTKKSNKNNIFFLNRLKNYNIYSCVNLLKKNLTKKLKKNKTISFIYLNFALFSCKNYQELKIVEKYLKFFFEFYKEKIKTEEFKRILFFFDNFNLIKNTKPEENDTNEKFPKFKEFILKI
jgi:hypothetical protein